MVNRKKDAGTHEAIDDNVRRHLRPLLNYARRQIRYHEALGNLPPGQVQTEAMVDAAFLRVIESLREQPAGASLLPMLRRAVRESIEEEVREARRQRSVRYLHEPIRSRFTEEGSRPRRLIEIIPDPTSPIPEDVVIGEEYQRAIARLLGRLPESWREPLLLYGREGLSLGEIARLEGVSVQEVQRRIAKARQFLQAWLEEEYETTVKQPSLEDIVASVERVESSEEHSGRLMKRMTATA